MRSTRFILILGLLVSFLPFLGFPSGMKDFLYVSCGILIVVFSRFIAKKDSKLTQTEKRGEVVKKERMVEKNNIYEEGESNE